MGAKLQTAAKGTGKCACGGTGSGAGTCHECRRKHARHLSGPGGGGAGFSVTPSGADDVLRSPGQPLDLTTRGFMEPHFGHDFSHVRVHTGARAAESAQNIQALAFTAGHSIVFGEGQYSPRTGHGQRLLAHELAHVVQQSRSRAPAPAHGASDQKLEREADRAADHVLAGRAVSPLSTTPAPLVQRQASETRSAEAARPAVRRDRQPLPNSGRGGNRFDAVLDREQSLLTITMRVAFRFDSAPGTFNEPWTPEREAQWKADFIRLNMAHWSDRYVLAPDGACPTESMSQVRVLIVVEEDTRQPHFRVSVNNQELPAQSGVRQDRQGHFNVSDVRQHFLSDAGTYQTTAEHEFGHMLGLPHIRCSGNQPECYGMSPSGTQQDREDVMGVGSEVSKRDYEVFAEVMQQATNCRWKVEEKSSGLTALLIGLGVALGAAALGLGIAAAAGAFSR